MISDRFPIIYGRRDNGSHHDVGKVLVNQVRSGNKLWSIVLNDYDYSIKCNQHRSHHYSTDCMIYLKDLINWVFDRLVSTLHVTINVYVVCTVIDGPFAVKYVHNENVL